MVALVFSVRAAALSSAVLLATWRTTAPAFFAWTMTLSSPLTTLMTSCCFAAVVVGPGEGVAEDLLQLAGEVGGVRGLQWSWRCRWRPDAWFPSWEALAWGSRRAAAPSAATPPTAIAALALLALDRDSNFSTSWGRGLPPCGQFVMGVSRCLDGRTYAPAAWRVQFRFRTAVPAWRIGHAGRSRGGRAGTIPHMTMTTAEADKILSTRFCPWGARSRANRRSWWARTGPCCGCPGRTGWPGRGGGLSGQALMAAADTATVIAVSAARGWVRSR